MKCKRCGREIVSRPVFLEIGYGRTCAALVGLVYDKKQKKWLQGARIKADTLADILGLVDVLVEPAQINTWSDLERVDAQVWASAAYLRASDNAIHVPQRPAVLQGLPTVSAEMMKRGAIV